jgi:hypothetical protein
MLDGRYMNDVVRGYCAPIGDETPFAVDVFLGIDRDLSGEPSSLVLLLDQPVTIAGHRYESIEAQLYGFDRSMAPAGKGTIKVELPASYAYWKQLYDGDRERYNQEKQKVADQVIEVWEGTGGIGLHEVIDVPSDDLGALHGRSQMVNLPNRKFDLISRRRPDKKFKRPSGTIQPHHRLWATMVVSSPECRLGKDYHPAHLQEGRQDIQPATSCLMYEILESIGSNEFGPRSSSRGRRPSRDGDVPIRVHACGRGYACPRLRGCLPKKFHMPGYSVSAGCPLLHSPWINILGSEFVAVWRPSASGSRDSKRNLVRGRAGVYASICACPRTRTGGRGEHDLRAGRGQSLRRHHGLGPLRRLRLRSGQDVLAVGVGHRPMVVRLAKFHYGPG